jgi:hypothetical protein
VTAFLCPDLSINPMLWANMLGIEQRDNIAIATPERAFLDKPIGC